MKQNFLLIAIASLLLTSSLGAIACIDPKNQNQTFFNKLPKNALKKEVVAKAKILPRHEAKKIAEWRGLWPWQYMTPTIVTEAIKGVEIGDKIMVFAMFTSCSQDYDLNIGGQYLISGSLDERGVFYGKWAAGYSSQKPL